MLCDDDEVFPRPDSGHPHEEVAGAPDDAADTGDDDVAGSALVVSNGVGVTMAPLVTTLGGIRGEGS